ncbi:MAG TPA: NAD(P)-binding protein [Acidimicrobiales bacterium]|nr:NAD(P)-binding protein [Acidimicrobiales bacterium]
MRSLETDYLVVGAGAMGMAFTDALIDHADVHVTLVDRRHAAGGHWQDAYPFVQLHQASVFYGVASTVLGTGAVQQQGPETGLQERARRAEIQSYYDDILHRRFVGSGKVTFLGGSEHRTDGDAHLVTSRVSGETVRVDVRRRVVDATYLSPTIPATTPPPFGVADGAAVVAVNELADLADTPSTYVIVGSGKTATDGIVWLLRNGVPPDRITWVRPREPWMLNRAVVQPDPVVALGLAVDTMASAAAAESLDDLFLRLEAAGVMLRIDPDRTPTMAKTPTLGSWELDLLRTVEHVIRLGHISHVTSSELVLAGGVVPLAPGSLVVHCAASGLQYPPMVPVWGPDQIRPQTIRVGFPCFNAALAGYVEATRDDDRERNRLCPPNTLPDSPADWARMQVLGALAVRSFGAEPDIADWANRCALNPARIDESRRDDPGVRAAAARLADVAEPGLRRLAELADERRPLTAGAGHGQ